MQNLKVFGVCLSFEDIRGFPEEHTQMNSPKFFRIFSQRPSFLHYELIHCNRDTERRQNFPQSSSSVFSHYGLPGFSSVLPHQRPYRKHCTPSHCSFNNASLRANFILAKNVSLLPNTPFVVSMLNLAQYSSLLYPSRQTESW